MAKIIGGITTSHVPAIGGAIAKGKQEEPYWKPFFDNFAPVRQWLTSARPDVVVWFYNDHGLHFFLDNLPNFAVGCAPEYGSRDEGWGIPPVPTLPGEPTLSWHIVEQLVANDFDPSTCQQMSLDHAATIPMKLLWPDQRWPATIVPIAINTLQFPIPSARRCFALGEAVGRAIRSWDSNKRVLIMGTGGLSHQLDGERAGFLNRAFDLQFMDSLADGDPRWATQYSMHTLVEKTGTQGIELIMWLAARAALGEKVRCLHRNHHIPISNTAAGLMLLEPTDG
jgi:protocatechuate 4,5-dioxygenase beta chain